VAGGAFVMAVSLRMAKELLLTTHAGEREVFPNFTDRRRRRLNENEFYFRAFAPSATEFDPVEPVAGVCYPAANYGADYPSLTVRNNGCQEQWLRGQMPLRH
jgi:hypothetical protein